MRRQTLEEARGLGLPGCEGRPWMRAWAVPDRVRRQTLEEVRGLSLAGCEGRPWMNMRPTRSQTCRCVALFLSVAVKSSPMFISVVTLTQTILMGDSCMRVAAFVNMITATHGTARMNEMAL